MKIDINHIAKLARLGLTDTEKKKYEGQLGQILDYIEQLKEVDTEGVEPTSHATGVKNVSRKDKAQPSKPELISNLVKSAPEHKEGFVKVKKVFE
jgi:aspartyl-tRNA(Asn)/glutamyl-tRNA(Gln) amidotransferase subunit C